MTTIPVDAAAVYIACAFLLGLLTSEAIGKFSSWMGRRRRQADDHPAAAEESSETYGHPRSPAKALAKALPPAPEGTLWEITVYDGSLEHGPSVIMACHLRDLEGSSLGSHLTDLLWTTRRGEVTTFIEEYEDDVYSDEWTMRTRLIAPIVQWATGLTAAITASRFRAGGEHIIKSE